MATEPGLFDALAGDRTLVEVAIEESLRMDPPVQLLMRTCAASTVVGGEIIDEGEAVIFGIEQANRDRTRFEDPESFRLDRSDIRRHLAFGGGPHVCPGAHLARMEARVAVNVLLDMVGRGAGGPGSHLHRRAGPLGTWTEIPTGISGLVTSARCLTVFSGCVWCCSVCGDVSRANGRPPTGPVAASFG